MMETNKEAGRIITFYSYKGGAGRSMAMANIAWILASNGKRVLAVDWDLEAPGLHRYFYPFLVDQDLISSDGIIDMVIDYAATAVTPPDPSADMVGNWYEEQADILRYATALEWSFPEPGTLDFVSAGRQGASYATRVNSFNWQDFYERLGGGLFIEAVKRKMRAEYDYILIDSRTGVSDTSGICTVQMPDYLVVCFTLNNQSIEGAASVAESVQRQRGKSGIRIFPIPTRVEFAEKERLDWAREFTKRRFSSLLDHIFKQEQDLYWGQVEIVYQPFYAYEEILATFGDTPGQTNSLLAAMERITGFLTERKVNHAEALDDAERQRFLELYTRRLPSIATNEQSAEVERDLSNTEARLSPVGKFAYICYSPVDAQEFALRIAVALTDGSPPTPVWLDKLNLNRAEDADYQIAEAIRTCNFLLFVMSPDSVGPNSICKEEWARALTYKKPIIPLRLQPSIETPLRLANRQAIDFASDFEQSLERLRNHLQWLASPAGILQSLTDRLTDTQRDLRLAEDPVQRSRLQDELTQIQQQMTEQTQAINRAQVATEAGESRIESTLRRGLASGIYKGFENLENDIFISYAHIDNQSLDSGRGWVDNFSERLRVRLLQLTGNEPKIWRDPRMGGNQLFEDNLIQRMSDTLLLIPIVSPRYVKSEWCLSELRAFYHSAEQRGGINIGNQSRIFPVIKTFVSRELFPPELQNMLGYEFFEIDEQIHRPREYSQETDGHLYRRYLNKLEDIAWDIKVFLEAFRLHSEVVDSIEVPITKRIYLAETTSDMQAERDRIKRELQQRGYYVLPDKQLPLSSPALQSAVRESLNQCIISIHLIGETYGFIPEGEDTRSITRIQYDLATERSIDPAFHRIAWMPRGLKYKDSLQEEFINHLMHDMRNRRGAELLQTTLEDLKYFILGKLEQALHATADVKEQGRTKIYVICSRQDIEEATPLIEHLYEKGFEVLLPAFEVDGSTASESHKEQLLFCDAVVIFYGRANANWVRTRLRELQKIPGYGRSQAFLGQLIYINGSRTEDKDSLTFKDALVIRNYATFSPDLLEPYVTLLSNGRRPG